MKARSSKSAKAGLIFPVTKFKTKLKQVPQYVKRVSEKASVYLTSVIEYLIVEILEISGNVCRDQNLKRINPRHIKLAIATDTELAEFLKKVIIPGSGVFPAINSSLFNTTSKLKSTIAKLPIKQKPNLSVKKIKSAKLQVQSLINQNKNEHLTIIREKTLKTGQNIKIVQANIVNLTVDAIVHPTNASFYLGGQIGQAIRNKGGKTIEKIISDIYLSRGPLEPAGVEISEASENMNYKKIIHINSPRWDISNPTECTQDLTKCVNNILKFANNNDIKSLAIPSISSGGNGFPKQVAAETILRAINTYFQSITDNISINQVFFVLYDLESVNVFISELDKLVNT